MAQELHVLKCFSCETFQSHIVKKTNKWECKICGLKQSIKKVYGRGSGKDCRLHTQKLNTLKGEKEDKHVWEKDSAESASFESVQNNLYSSSFSTTHVSPKVSKWEMFIDKDKIDMAKTEIPLQNKVKSLTDIKISDGTSKRQKKRKLCETGSLEYSNCVKANSVENNCSNINPPSSIQHTTTTKSEKIYYKEDNNKTNILSNCEAEKKIYQMMETPISEITQYEEKCSKQICKKWTKYLELNTNQEENSCISKPSILSPTVMINCSAFNISHHETNSDFDRNKISQPTYYSFGCFDESKCQDNSYSLSDMPDVSVSNQSEHFFKERQVLHELNHSDLQPTLTLPVFEQDSDLNDSDFQLDF